MFKLHLAQHPEKEQLKKCQLRAKPAISRKTNGICKQQHPAPNVCRRTCVTNICLVHNRAFLPLKHNLFKGRNGNAYYSIHSYKHPQLFYLKCLHAFYFYEITISLVIMRTYSINNLFFVVFSIVSIREGHLPIFITSQTSNVSCIELFLSISIFNTFELSYENQTWTTCSNWGQTYSTVAGSVNILVFSLLEHLWLSPSHHQFFHLFNGWFLLFYNLKRSKKNTFSSSMHHSWTINTETFLSSATMIWTPHALNYPWQTQILFLFIFFTFPQKFKKSRTAASIFCVFPLNYSLSTGFWTFY